MNNKLMLGIGKEIITPEVGGHLYGYAPDVFSESMHDDLTATAYAFVCGETKVMFVSATVCALNDSFADDVRREISQNTNFPFENIIISATHTHSGPCLSGGEIGWGGFDTEYAENIFVPGIVKACVNAAENLEYVKVGIASGDSFVAVNRRELVFDDNHVALGQCPWGAFNPKMTVISFRNEEGIVKGNIIAYGCHGTAAGRNHEITRDWSGIMTDALEAATGGVTAFFNGTIGDTGPRLSNGKTVGDIHYVEELGAVAAADAIKIFNCIEEYKDENIAIVSTGVTLPLLPRESYEYVCEKNKEYEGKKLVNLSALTQKHYQLVKESYENGYVEETERTIEQIIFRIGNVSFVTSPYEMFSEIGLRIDKEIENLNVYLMSNANGSHGYFVTQDQLCLGGYEVGYFLNRHIQRFPDDADYRYIKATCENFKKLER